jgi:CRISPR system Cascade subunit CasC
MTNTNPYKNTRIEFHILQSFPVTCLNRDDVGAPKTAVVGGVTRARVSSQCWKRQVRLAMKDLGVHVAERTKKVENKITQICLLLVANCHESLLQTTDFFVVNPSMASGFML